MAELEIDDEMDLNELDLESSAESQSISSTETPHEQTNERKRKVFNGFCSRIFVKIDVKVAKLTSDTLTEQLL